MILLEGNHSVEEYMNKKIRIAGLLIAAGCMTITMVSSVNASPIGRLNQTIGAGVLSTDIVDTNNAPVANPSFGMSSTNISSGCQTSTGSYGSASQRVAVDNPGGANGGWSLVIALTGGPGSDWTSGSNTFKADDPTDSGCALGQLTLDPSDSTLSLIGASSSTGVTQGSQASFSNGLNDSITLLNAAASSDDIWSGYLTDIGVSQTIPAQTPAGSYTIDLTQTVTAT